MFPDATTLFADVITIAADLAIGHHRGPLSGRCKQGITDLHKHKDKYGNGLPVVNKHLIDIAFLFVAQLVQNL